MPQDDAGLWDASESHLVHGQCRQQRPVIFISSSPLMWLNSLTKVTSGRSLFWLTLKVLSTMTGKSRPREFQTVDHITLVVEGDGWMQTSAQSPFSIYTVQNPSQGMIPLTVSRSSHFKIAPHSHNQRPFTQVILDSLS